VVVTTAPDPTQALSFGQAAAAYQRGRPGYPASAIDWLLPAGARPVLDLAAGTGQLSRDLADRGLDVVAVEPDPGMRAQLLDPRVRVLAGRAEGIPLPTESVDAALVGQAWHWFQVDQAVTELARVLRPGGQLGLVWNVRDERVDWVALLGALMHRGHEQDMGSQAPRVGPPFLPIERRDFHWEHVTSRSELLDLVSSRSYVITLPVPERQQLLGEVTRLLDTHPALSGADEVRLPYVTRCSRTSRFLGQDALAG
jgi:SAM-dependent methyltransferase